MYYFRKIIQLLLHNVNKNCQKSTKKTLIIRINSRFAIYFRIQAIKYQKVDKK